MAKFLAEYHWLLFAIVKIAIMLGFFLQMAPLLVFAERRQAALIQDRIGPNRAMISVPGMLLKGAFATPALLGALAVAAISFALFPPTMVQATEDSAATVLTGVARGFWMTQVAVLALWTHVLVLTGFVRLSDSEKPVIGNPLEAALASLEDPRWFFYLGLIAHVTLFGLYGMAAQPAVAKVFAYGGPVLLAAVLFLIGGYAGYRIPSGQVDLRIAGVIHSIADTLKLAFKEDFLPPNADKLLHSLAPFISLFPALVTFAIIPFGDTLCFGQTPEGMLDATSPLLEVPRTGACASGIELQIADLNVGILYLFAIAGTGIVGAAIAGSSSDNKWSLLGGLRAASQMVSYEVAMGLSLVGAFMVYGSPRLGDMARWQGENTWGIFVQPLAFFLFFAAAIAEQKRTPFDAPEGESEIIAGYFVEYSSFKFVMFYTGEYVEIVTSSALLVAIFLGGWNLPFLHRDGITVSFGDTTLYHAAMTHLGVTILQVLAFFGKVIVLSFGQIFIRWTLPRFRYDQIMSFGWKMLLPAAIGNLVVTGLLILVIGQAGPAVASIFKLLADASQLLVVVVVAVLVVRLVLLILAPVERKRFTRSTAAATAVRLGGVKEGTMQA
jgi:NADH-quinone oxidoreductase subunit H